MHILCSELIHFFHDITAKSQLLHRYLRVLRFLFCIVCWRIKQDAFGALASESDISLHTLWEPRLCKCTFFLLSPYIFFFFLDFSATEILKRSAGSFQYYLSFGERKKTFFCHEEKPVKFQLIHAIFSRVNSHGYPFVFV